jgi:hypothetical protein
MVFFKMNFVRKDSSGALRDGLAVTNQHTYWNHAEKDLVRICRAVPGYVMHGETVVTKPGAYEVKIGESRDAYVEYIDDEGKLFGALTAPVASSSPQAEINASECEIALRPQVDEVLTSVSQDQSLDSRPELTRDEAVDKEQSDSIEIVAQAMISTPEEDEDAPRTEDIFAPVSDVVYRGIKPFRM